MNTAADRAVEKYLKRLDGDLADLPRARRREIVDEIAEHIAEARAETPAQNEAETRILLERLGDPADIAADARQRFDVVPARPGWMETAALVLLLFGGFAFFFGWVIGLILLWSSAVWTPWEKLLGTLIVPGGLAGWFFLLAFVFSTSGASFLTLFGVALLFVAPLVTTAYLALEMRRRTRLTTA
jgi:uncharacterized membrane protein